MLNLIYALKFVHMLAAGAMFGAWLAIAVFMVLGHCAQNPSVVAVVSRFVVRVELFITAAAIVLQPITGILLASAIGLSPSDQFWIMLSLAIFAVVVLCWLAALIIEIRVRNLTREATLGGQPLPPAYGKLFRLWSALALPILAGMVALFAVMIWQPRLD